ncbi:chymotrypsin-2-like [Daphnia pulex]|uniref:chymotrypsin-2-like n=1 Tax=Daphnia pulex TaxID=6669 RepID=UPI001EE05FB4|nr:chymotrypsin-2-like [Daphnia pulex]
MFGSCWIYTAVFVYAFMLAVLKTGAVTKDVTIFGDDSISRNETTKVNFTRIVGGAWAKRGAYPYQVAIFVKKEFTCGGTLLEGGLHVLTAAHCINPLGREAGLITLYFRTTVLNPLDAIHIERKAAKFVTHPSYNSTSFENDLGVITLSKPVFEIRPVKLERVDPFNQTHIGKEATVIGWGRTRQVLHPAMSSGAASNHLRHVNVTILDTKDCSVLYYHDYELSDGKRLCASTLFGKSICQGDSGGPLLINGLQVGINSAAAGCADPRFPALFIRVAAYVDWIKTVVGKSVPVMPVTLITAA